MSRTPARFTQADIARTLRAAKQAGADAVEIHPDGAIFVHLSGASGAGKTPPQNEKALESDGGAVL
jgi:hypothetical protein